MTTTTRPVKGDLGGARRETGGTAARTTNTTSNAKIEPSSFMAVAHPPPQASGDRRSPLLFFRRAGRLGAAKVARVSLAADRHVQHRRPARPSLRVEVHELVDDWRHVHRHRDAELASRLDRDGKVVGPAPLAERNREGRGLVLWMVLQEDLGHEGRDLEPRLRGDIREHE